MRYELEWDLVADNQLMALWIDAVDRDAVTTASARLIHHLTYRPLTMGMARQSSVSRIAFEPPLGIYYEVIEDDKKVIVQGVIAI